MNWDNYTNILENQPILTNVLEAVQEMVLILDQERHIVYFNNKFREFTEEYGLIAELGISPGDAFHCINVTDGDARCGTTDFCRYCGGDKTIKNIKNGISSSSECRIVSLNGNSFDIHVSASPITLEGNELILYCIMDTSSESRKQILEKIFFHDINNIVNAMSLIMELLQGGCDQKNHDEFLTGIELMNSAMNSLKNEINAQHIITLAEKDELNVSPVKTSAKEMITDICEFFSTSTVGNGIDLIFKPSGKDEIIDTDPMLLKRVLINMVKNACEASNTGGQVEIGYKKQTDNILIHVHNETVMTDEVSKSIFKRSFSTKGEGRGLGTYSMRLLTERYLKGRIYFDSKEGKGTTFYLELPFSLPDPQ